MHKDWQKFPTLFSLYIAQSIPMSFFSTVVPVIMRQENYSLGAIGLLQLIKLPWILKFLWAPFIDSNTKTSHQIKQWIIGSEIFYAIIILSIGFFNLKTDFTVIIILMVIAFIASATQDIATDIFAIYILKKKERSIGNSIQSAGSFVGSLFGTGVLLIAYHYFGWTGLITGLAACVAFAIIPAARYKGKIRTEKSHEHKVGLRDIGTFFKDKVLRRRTLLLAFYYSGLIGILTLLKPYLVDLGYNVKEIGFMSGIIGTSTAILSSFVAGIFIKKVGRKLAFYLIALAGLGTSTYYFFLPEIPSLFQIYTAICLLWGVYAFSSVIIYTTSMDAVRKHREGTDFTLQIVITHLSSIIIAIASGKLGDALGYHGIFKMEIILGIITIALLFILMPINRKSLTRRFK